MIGFKLLSLVTYLCSNACTTICVTIIVNLVRLDCEMVIKLIKKKEIPTTDFKTHYCGYFKQGLTFRDMTKNFRRNRVIFESPAQKLQLGRFATLCRRDGWACHFFVDLISIKKNVVLFVL